MRRYPPGRPDRCIRLQNRLLFNEPDSTAGWIRHIGTLFVCVRTEAVYHCHEVYHSCGTGYI